MQFIRNQKGRVIGKLWVLADGTRRIYDQTGILKGWYDPAADRTVNARTGSWMGFGDQTLLLLCD